MAVRVGFIGAGRVARALSGALAAAGWEVVAVYSRDAEKAQRFAAELPGCRVAARPQEVVDWAEAVFLTVPDGSIEAVAAGLQWRDGMMAIHCSGSLSLDVLDAAASHGALAGSFHPLLAVTEDPAGGAFAGCAVAIEGQEAVAGMLESMALAIGARPFRLPAGSKALYHAGAVFASNYVVTLLHEAALIWQLFGRSETESLRELLPLLKGTVANLERLGPARALTGPIARGDAGTLSRHLAALDAQLPAVADLYRVLGRATVQLAAGSEAVGEDLLTALDGAAASHQ